ncbi:MAG: hypothetical protein ACI35R_13145 [Bacillus sp. (in: firmicutes)]
MTEKENPIGIHDLLKTNNVWTEKMMNEKDQKIRQQRAEIEKYRAALRKIAMVKTDGMFYQMWAERALKEQE